MKYTVAYNKDQLQLAELINDASIDRIAAIDANYLLVAWNKANELYTGISKEHAIGRDIFEVIPVLAESPEIINAIKHAMKGFKSFVPTKENAFEDGCFDRYFVPLKDNTDNVKGVLIIARDASQRLKMQNELDGLNKLLEHKSRELKIRNAELTAFTQVASHDLKEPLRRIYTFIEMILVNEAERMTDKGKLHFKRIQSAVQRMGLLTDDIGAFAHLETEFAEISEVDLNSIAKYAMNNLHEQIKQSKAIITIDKLPMVNGRRHLLSQLFQNIIANAIKFQSVDNRPVIKITATVINGNEINHPDVTRGIDYYCINFRDNGIGFDNKYADRIFDMFQKLNPAEQLHSTGIGLSICKKVAEIHHGFIVADGKPGSGSNFLVYLPTFIAS